MKRISTLKTVLIALFAALICVATMLVQIPIPATGGFANLGDGVILVCAGMMHPLCAALAAGIGSMLADILAGYAVYAPATLLIKAGAACLFAHLSGYFCRRCAPRRAMPGLILSAAAAEAIVVLGYFAYEAVVLGYGAVAAGGIAGNAGQGVIGVAVVCMGLPLLKNSAELNALMKKTWQ